MKQINRLPRPVMAVLLVLAGLLMLLLPAGVAHLGDAELFSGTVPRPAMEGQLSGQAQEIPVVYALYRRRILSGGEESLSDARETSTAEQALSMSGTVRAMADAGILPQSCRNAAKAVFESPDAMAFTGQQNGFIQKSYQGYDGPTGEYRSISIQQQEETGLVTACAVSAEMPDWQEEACTAEEILKSYRDYLGLGELTDWQTAGTAAGGAVGWSETGQIYLYCSFGEERFALGAVSLSEEQLEIIADGFS